MQRRIHGMLFLAAISLTPSLQAAPQMSMEVKAWKDIVVVENGKQIKKRVAANDQSGGEVLIYTIDYANRGNERATAIKIDNAVPEGTSYVLDSADGAPEILFSIDSGKSFKQPALLTYEARDKSGKAIQMKASPESITNIRWVIPEVPPGTTGQVTYQVRVE